METLAVIEGGQKKKNIGNQGANFRGKLCRFAVLKNAAIPYFTRDSGKKCPRRESNPDLRFRKMTKKGES